MYTVKPLNNRLLGTNYFWPDFNIMQRLSSLRGKIVLPWSWYISIIEKLNVLCYLFGVSFQRGSVVAKKNGYLVICVIIK